MTTRFDEMLLADLEQALNKRENNPASPPRPRKTGLAFEDQPCKICTAPRRICCC